MPRVVTTPITGGARPAAGRPRRIDAALLEAVLPGPGRDRLGAGEVLVVTTGQQPVLFTGPLYVVYKALTAIVLARRLARERGVPVVPVFWVAGDDHDFAEANHTWILDKGGDAARIALPERPADAPLAPLARERCGPAVGAALDALRDGTPDSEFKAQVLEWLAASYRPEATLADAFSRAIHALLGERGLAVFQAHHPAAKRIMAPLVLRALDVVLDDGHLPVLVEASGGRDRLRGENGGYVTRRSGERFSREDLERIAAREPERLSANVLLRPAVEAALFPTVAYAAGPSELEYFPRAAPLYRVLNGAAGSLEPQPAVARWSGVLIESRVDKVLEKHGLTLDELAAPPGALEGRLVRDTVSPETAVLLAEVRKRIEDEFARLAAAVAGVDPTLERSVQSVRNAALSGTADVEKKLVAALKRANETLVGQLARARAALYPAGKPQERALTLASFLIRYGRTLVDAIEAEVARWAGVS
jgi:uncharacterized protein YllA (UPF0747 family)